MIPGILLAAGTSSRMGQAKQLLDWRGQPLVRHVAQQALASSLDGLFIVVGHEAAAVRAALDSLPIQFVENAAYTEGQASSLRAGLAALPAEADAAVVLLCDQPLVTPGLIDSVVKAFERMRDTRHETESSEQSTNDHRSPINDSHSSLITHHSSLSPVAVIPRYKGQRGNPVLLARTLFAELANVRGNEGARSVLGRYRERVRWFDLDDPAVVTDIDTVEAYEALKYQYSLRQQGSS